MTIFGDGQEIRFGETVHSNMRPGFFISAPDTRLQSLLTESEEEANAKVEELKGKSKWPDAIYARKVTLADEKTGDSGKVRLVWFVA